jgi:hypothetical protein
MAKLSLEDFEEGVRDAYRQLGIRAGEGLSLMNISVVWRRNPSLRADDLNEALRSLIAKGELTLNANDYYILTDAGYASL